MRPKCWPTWEIRRPSATHPSGYRDEANFGIGTLVTTDARDFPQAARMARQNARLQGALGHLKEGFQVGRAAAFAPFPLPSEALRELGRAIGAPGLWRPAELPTQFETELRHARSK